MKEISAIGELLALRGEDGVIRVNGDLTIACNVPWSVGKDIAGLVVTGDLVVPSNVGVGGNVDVAGKLNVRGALEVVGYLVVGGNLAARSEHERN